MHLTPQNNVLVPIEPVVAVVSFSRTGFLENPFVDYLLPLRGNATSIIAKIELSAQPRPLGDVFEEIVVLLGERLGLRQAFFKLGLEVGKCRSGLELPLCLFGTKGSLISDELHQ